MKLSAPKKTLYIIALILAIVVLVAKLVPALSGLIPPVIMSNLFWGMTAAYVLLFLGTTFKGL